MTIDVVPVLIFRLQDSSFYASLFPYQTVLLPSVKRYYEVMVFRCASDLRFCCVRRMEQCLKTFELVYLFGHFYLYLLAAVIPTKSGVFKCHILFQVNPHTESLPQVLESINFVSQKNLATSPLFVFIVTAYELPKQRLHVYMETLCNQAADSRLCFRPQ